MEFANSVYRAIKKIWIPVFDMNKILKMQTRCLPDVDAEKECMRNLLPATLLRLVGEYINCRLLLKTMSSDCRIVDD